MRHRSKRRGTSRRRKTSARRRRTKSVRPLRIGYRF